MPFCTQCGADVVATAAFCQKCGSPQPAAQMTKGQSFLDSMSARTASILCYIPVAGWIPCVVFLAGERFRNDNNVRFHAFQGLYLFVAWLVLDASWGIGSVLHLSFGSARYHLDRLLHMALIGVWIYMLIQTSQNVRVRLPLIGEWAERSLSKGT
ncbi:MAG: zinc-ribbon domain-containing protein [Bryobacteraceae bacterium]